MDNALMAAAHSLALGGCVSPLHASQRRAAETPGRAWHLRVLCSSSAPASHVNPREQLLQQAVARRRSLQGRQQGSLVVRASTVAVENVETLVVQPVKKISGTVKLPGSKSLSNRLLLLAALSEVRFLFPGLSWYDACVRC